MWGFLSQVLLSVFVLHSWLYVAPTDGKKVVCYYTNWAQYRPAPGKYVVSNVYPFACTHIIFAFAQLNGTDVVAYEKNDDQLETMWAQATKLKDINPKLKVLLALGGYTHGTERFSLLAASAELRAKFIKYVITRLRYWRFDGLDLDWEYPGLADKQNINLLVKETKEAFRKEALNNNDEELLLAAAVPAGISRVEQGYDVAFLNQYLDFFSIMAYDYHGLWENVTGLGSPLNAPEGDTMSVTSTVNYYLQHGASKEKIVLGIGLYGRTWTLNPGSTNTGVGAPALGGGNAGTYTREPGVVSYYEACLLLNNGYTAQIDPLGKVMYAYKGNQWVTYENRETIEYKLNYILENDFAGAMIWSLDHDDFTGSFCQQGVNPLITVISGTLINAPDSSTPNSTAVTTSSTATSTVSSATTASTVTSTQTTTQPTTASTQTTTQPTTASTQTTTQPTTTSTPTTTQPTTASTPTTTKPTTTRTSTTVTPVKGTKFSCPNQNGKYPDIADCSKYFVCYLSHPIRTYCSNSMKFSPSRKECVLSGPGECPL